MSGVQDDALIGIVLYTGQLVPTFTVQVSLRLLDSDFPDESVRAFAVKILEGLPDEQLEDFLLQLVQVFYVM